MIPAEAVEAAAKRAWLDSAIGRRTCEAWESLTEIEQMLRRDDVRKILEAAAPHMPQQVAVIHGGQDAESHARSFNEGYEAAVTQGLADDPTLAGDWLDEKLAEAWDEGMQAMYASTSSEWPPIPEQNPYRPTQ